MIKVQGFKIVEYDTFVGILYDTFKRSRLTTLDLANAIGARSTQTATNSFAQKGQLVSDYYLTKTMEALGVEGFTLSHKGVKYYYVKG